MVNKKGEKMTNKQKQRYEELKALEKAEKKQKTAENKLHEKWLKREFGLSVADLKKIINEQPKIEKKIDMSYVDYTANPEDASQVYKEFF